MQEKVEISLRDGTLVRHKNRGYEGKIEGTTAIKACFTRGGALPDAPNNKEAFQYRVVVDGQSNPDAAWYYPDPKPAAADITNWIAFWHGVTIEP
jgi:hypothetical protein